MDFFNKNISINLYLLATLLGMIWFLWLTETMIFRWPRTTQPIVMQRSACPEEKNISIFFWKHNTWQQEAVHTIWLEQPTENLKAIISQWLKIMGEESSMPKTVSIESVIIADKELFISFTHPVLVPAHSTFEKWMIIEGLLKTLYEFIPHIDAVRFLVHHKPMHDYHLDFAHSWPKNGYFEKK